MKRSLESFYFFLYLAISHVDGIVVYQENYFSEYSNVISNKAVKLERPEASFHQYQDHHSGFGSRFHCYQPDEISSYLMAILVNYSSIHDEDSVDDDGVVDDAVLFEDAMDASADDGGGDERVYDDDC